MDSPYVEYFARKIYIQEREFSRDSTLVSSLFYSLIITSSSLLKHWTHFLSKLTPQMAVGPLTTSFSAGRDFSLYAIFIFLHNWRWHYKNPTLNQKLNWPQLQKANKVYFFICHASRTCTYIHYSKPDWHSMSIAGIF